MRKSSLSFVILVLCLFFVSIPPIKIGVNTQSSSEATRVEQAVNFLMSQFNPRLNLCREASNVAPNTYWLVDDNLWAYKALEMTNRTDASALIKAELIELAQAYKLPTDVQGLPISYAHEAVIGDTVLVPFYTYTNCTLHRNDCTLNTTILNGTVMENWQDYADLLLYAALSHHWQGNDTAANQYLEAVKGMWDGRGINDTATKRQGFYTTFKLALLLYTSKALGKKLPFEFDLVNRIWSLQRKTDGGIITNYFADGTSHGDANTETTSIVVIAIIAQGATDTFAFYYPWYGTPNVSGYWRHWNDCYHNPENITDGRRDIAAAHYPLLGVYNSNNESLIKQHIDMAKEARIDGFVVSWWGIGPFEDNALLHIKNVCEQSNFKFTIYYEITSGVDQTMKDIMYILDNYASSSAYYKIENRPVIYIYCRARDKLRPQAWKLYGEYINEGEGVQEHWMLSEEVRKPSRYGLFPIHPDSETRIGYIESANPILLPPNETYGLKAAISDIRNDCPNYSDVGFRIKIRNETEDWETLYESIVNFNDGWLDLSFDVSNYAGQNVTMRVESYAGGVESWCSEWAAVDYFYTVNSKEEIVSPEPFFDNGWKTTANSLKKLGYNPYLIMDFGGYESKIQDFTDYFLNFTDGMHTYNPCMLSLSEISEIYVQARNATNCKNKFFVATVMPGYDDTKVRSPSHVVGRGNGTYYSQFWSIAKACLPDGYVITSFNEWHEGTEIEPSQEDGDQYMKLTRTLQTPVHDTTVVSVETAQNEVYPGQIVNVTVVVRNNGVVIETFNVTAYANTTVIQTLTVSGLPPAKQINLTFHWDTTGATLGNYIISAEASRVEEAYPTDNVYINGMVNIIPEFPSFLILLPFMIATLLIVIVYRIKHST